jgi:hypothetical protein
LAVLRGNAPQGPVRFSLDLDAIHRRLLTGAASGGNFAGGAGLQLATNRRIIAD